MKKRWPDELESLPNIGKKTADKLREIGIQTADDFLARDPYEVFDELLVRVDPTLCRCALAGIFGAKQGFPWHKITKQAVQEYAKRRPNHKWGRC